MARRARPTAAGIIAGCSSTRTRVVAGFRCICLSVAVGRPLVKKSDSRLTLGPHVPNLSVNMAREDKNSKLLVAARAVAR